MTASRTEWPEVDSVSPSKVDEIVFTSPSRSTGLGREALASRGLAILIVLDTAAWVLGPELGRAVLVSLGCAIYYLFASKAVGSPIGFAPQSGWILVWMFVFLAIIRGLVDGNDPEIIVGDVFHWTIEIIVPALITRALLIRGGIGVIANGLFDGAWISAIFALAVAASGFVLRHSIGGHPVTNSSLWRLELGRVFPSLLILLLLMTRSYRSERGSLRLLLVTLMIALFATLKRIQLLGLIAAYWLGQALLRKGRVAWSMALVGLVVMIIVIPGEADESDFVGSLQVINYSDNFSLSATIATRLVQYTDTMPILLANPLGVGFGALYETSVTAGSVNTVFIQRETHYIHSGFMNAGLQFGWVGLIATIALPLVGVLKGRSLVGSNPEFASGLIGASLLMLISMGSLISYHTAVAGIWLGLVLGSGPGSPLSPGNYWAARFRRVEAPQ